MLPVRLRRWVALLVGVVVLAGACAGGDRPTLSGPPQTEAPPPIPISDLDPSATYVAAVDGPVDTFAAPADDEAAESVAPGSSGDVRVTEGFVLKAPYQVEPGWHEVYLPDGATAWVREDDVELQQTNVVALGLGTEVAPDGTGGGEVDVFAEPDGAEPAHRITNPTSADGFVVGPVVFLGVGPYDPTADWLQVNLPIRPNGSTGWVRARDVDIATNRFRIEVALTDHVLRLFDSDEQVLEEPIGVGTGNTPTPGGVFYIRSLIASTDPVYGTYAFGLSGFSEVHEEFNGGPGDIGIHGTNDPSTIGTDVSNGCIRLRDETVIHLAEVLPEAEGAQTDTPQISTGLGVPVEVLA